VPEVPKKAVPEEKIPVLKKKEAPPAKGISSLEVSRHSLII